MKYIITIVNHYPNSILVTIIKDIEMYKITRNEIIMGYKETNENIITIENFEYYNIIFYNENNKMIMMNEDMYELINCVRLE